MSSRSSTKDTASSIEALGATLTIFGFLEVVFLATVLTSLLPEGLISLVETAESTSSTLGVFLLVEVRVPYSKTIGNCGARTRNFKPSLAFKKAAFWSKFARQNALAYFSS
jgi:hypothetical protein